MVSFFGLTLIEWIPIGISLFALVFTCRDSIENAKQNRRTNKKAEKALRLSQGSTELNIRSSISEGRSRFNSFVFEVKKLELEHPQADLTGFNNLMKGYLEDLLNQYDTACVLYLDKKLDKKWFKKHYRKEIIQSVENPGYKDKYFNPKNVRFPGMVKVYNEWSKANIKSDQQKMD